MDGARWEILVRIMSRLAAGDQAATFALYNDFGGQIAAAVRRLAGSMGATLDADEVDGLVLEACLALMESAPSWDPDGGALPWNWAERKLRHIVAVQIGIYTDSLDDSHDRELDDFGPSPEGIASGDDDPVTTLARLAEMNTAAAAFARALRDVASERDQAIFLEVSVQASLGDRGPADTVGRMMGIPAATVRQIVKRVRDRLRAAGAQLAA